MEALYVPETDGSAQSDGRSRVPESLWDLATLTSMLTAKWSGLTDPSRLSLTRQIQRLAVQLGADVIGHLSEEVAPLATERLLFLTPRELDVLRSLAEGMSTKQVEESLGISQATVRSHVKSLLSKLGAHSRVEAVSLFLRNGSEPPWDDLVLEVHSREEA